MNKFLKFLITGIVFSVWLFPLGAEVYKNDAVVSYYAGDFNGKKTSNGEYFNMNDYTCASKNLPFDTVLKVTNLANGLSVNVRVNDRGPFVAGRELDLSKAAAKKIDMIKTGTAHVKIEIVKKGANTKLSQQTAAKAAQIMAAKTGTTTSKSSSTTTTTSSTAKKTYAAGTKWDIQLGSFSTRENANVLAQKLLKDGFKDVVFQKNSTTTRVIIRGVDGSKIDTVTSDLKNHGYTDYVIKDRKN